MTGPIIEFKTDEELQTCLKEWQTRLFLDGWIIKGNLCKPEEMILENVLGENDHHLISKVAYIRLLKGEYCQDDKSICATKFCQEKTLVHELLHCILNKSFDGTADLSYEQVALDLEEHTVLEQMAKSLIMAKYNIDFDWFKNI